jgi:hypothetical protein
MNEEYPGIKLILVNGTLGRQETGRDQTKRENGKEVPSGSIVDSAENAVGVGAMDVRHEVVVRLDKCCIASAN